MTIALAALKGLLLLAGSLLVLEALLLAEGQSAWGALQCFLAGRHIPGRVYTLGGFRCRRCGLAGQDLDDLGEEGGGYVSPGRRPRSRRGAA